VEHKANSFFYFPVLSSYNIYVCVDPEGSGHHLYLTSRVFCQVSQPQRDPVNSKRIYLVSGLFIFEKIALDSWDSLKIYQIESISHFKSTSNHSDHNIPPSANQTLGGVWPLLPLAWQVARPHESYMIGNGKPNFKI